jgi:hypothetical protein
VPEHRFAYVVAVVGSADVMSAEELERLLALLVNRHTDTHSITLVSAVRYSPKLQWCQGRGWGLVVEPEGCNTVKQDCALVAIADALVVLGAIRHPGSASCDCAAKPASRPGYTKRARTCRNRGSTRRRGESRLFLTQPRQAIPFNGMATSAPGGFLSFNVALAPLVGR